MPLWQRGFLTFHPLTCPVLDYFLFSLIPCLSCSFMASEPGRDTPKLKYIGLLRPWSNLHLKPQYVTDFVETSALNRTTALCMHLSKLYFFFFHTLLLTVHKLRRSALACNQCVMLLLALPINTQAENLFHPSRLMDRLSYVRWVKGKGETKLREVGA